MAHRLIFLSALVAALAAGCGAETASRPLLLDADSFKKRLAFTIERDTDLAAEPGFGFVVRVEEKGNWVELVLDEPFARYRRDPTTRDRVLAELADEARRRLAEGVEEDAWADARPALMPRLEPQGAVERRGRRLARRPFAKGLVVVYVVHREHELFFVGRDEVARWGVPLAEVDGIARKNLLERTEPLLCEEELCGWANGDGYDAARLTVPELRRDIVREIGPAAYAVPTRDLFVAVPVAYAKRIAPKVLHDFAGADHPVSPEVFLERRGRLVPIER